LNQYKEPQHDHESKYENEIKQEQGSNIEKITEMFKNLKLN
jgi:hypothetical protein